MDETKAKAGTENFDSNPTQPTNPETPEMQPIPEPPTDADHPDGSDNPQGFTSSIEGLVLDAENLVIINELFAHVMEKLQQPENGTDSQETASETGDAPQGSPVIEAEQAFSELDLTKYIHGQKLPEVSKVVLEKWGKRKLATAVTILISWYNYTTDEMNQLQAENQRFREQLARLRQCIYGSGSERRSTLENQGDSSSQSSTNSNKKDSSRKTGNGEDDQKADSNDLGTMAGTSSETAPDTTTEANSDSAGTTNHSADQTAKRKNRPVRHDGCADNVLKKAIHLTINRLFTEDELQERLNGHDYKKLSPENYVYVVYLQLPVVVNVSAERVQDLETKKTYCAAPASEEKFLSKSVLSPSILSRFIFMRYSMGVAVPRILKDLETKGLAFKKQSIYRWSIQYALALMRPMVNRMLHMILENGKIQADESWMKIREEFKKNNRRNSVVWLIRTSEKLNIPPIIVLSFTGSRASIEFAKIIKDYALSLIADGYSGYGALLKDYADVIELMGCLQHARARFVDYVQALIGKKEYQKLTKEEKAELPVNKILDKFHDLFHAEKQMDIEWDLARKKKYRQTKVRPLLDKLFELIEAEHKSSQEQNKTGYFAEALNYAVKFKDRFYKAVDDPEMPLHNSSCERVFAQFGILRSNFKQMDTILGAEACCLWFSVLQTAKLNGVNEQMYIEYLIEELPSILKEHGDYHWFTMKQATTNNAKEEWPVYADLSYLDTYMPWGDDFKRFSDRYMEREREAARRMADMFAS